MDYDPMELAKQLTLTELKVRDRIQPFELLSKKWLNRPKEAPNVLAIEQHFKFIVKRFQVIILETKDLNDRANVVLHILEIIRHLLSLKNLETAKALTTCLTSKEIARLKATWEVHVLTYMLNNFF
eukprot:TRINITY_DN10329_c0_g1_i2.p1 TRINITY_DN10329_c0_g1~~TRINITY_DN10329_c0_g1_i2.p1  ORF type:complete len:136 (-),score=19.86 TRINITY_DN10329_c0_g1_i2:475-852(-)